MRADPLPRLATLVALGGYLCSASPARAQAGDDTVFLQDGGRVRGTVMVEDKSSGVSIRLADGTTRQIALSQVLRVEYGAPAPAVAPASAPPEPAPAEAARVAGPLVRLESDDPRATLDMVLSQTSGTGMSGSGALIWATGMEWSTVCTMPCGKRLDPNRQYRIAGVMPQ